MHIQTSKLVPLAGRIVIAGAVGLGLSVACKSSRLNPNHCGNREGDRTCAELYPDGSRPFCGWGTCFEAEDGCVETMPGEPSCYSPCGGERTADDEDACIDITSATDTQTTATSGMTMTGTDGPNTMTGTGDTGPTTDTDPGTTGPMGCTEDADCGTGDPLEAFCVNDICTHCGDTPDGDAACASTYPATPVCVGETCEECTADNDSACNGDTPLCDDPSMTCIGCTDHAQCPETACDLSTGACIDGPLVHVDGDGGQDEITISAGYDALGGDGVIVIHAISGDQSYQETLVFDQSTTVAFLAAPGENPTWQGTAGNPTLNVATGSTAIFHRLTLEDGDAQAVNVDASTFIAQRSRFTQNTGGGITANNGATVTLENCFVGGNGTLASAMSIEDSDLDILYSTLVRGLNLGEPVLDCTSPISTTIRNSIIVNESTMPGAEIACNGATIQTTAVETTTDLSTWFPQFGQGDFSLGPAGATQFADIATWQTGDPTVDIGGDPRVAMDGATEHAGADVP